MPRPKKYAPGFNPYGIAPGTAVEVFKEGAPRTPAEQEAEADRRIAHLKRRRHGHYIKGKYKLDPAVYFRMLEIQRHCCLTCSAPESELQRRLGVDHNHATGQIRGLLCHSCNQALGVVKENSQTLRNLAAYLDYYERQSSK